MDFANEKTRCVMMANKLKIEVNNGRIDQDFAVSFINNVYERLKMNMPLSAKQVVILEELFDKY